MTPRTVWALVDDAIDLYRERFLLLVSAGALVYIPFQVAYFFFSMGPMRDFYKNAQTNASDPFAILAPLLTVIAWQPLLGVAVVLQAATASLIVQGHLAGETPTLMQVTKQLGKRAFPLLVSSFLVGLGIFLAALPTCGIAAFWVMIVTAFVSQSLILEKCGIRDAFRRARALTKGYEGRVLGLLLLAGGLVQLFTIGLSALLEALFSLFPLSQKGTLQGQMQEYVIKGVLNAIVTLLLAPVSGVATTLLYYDHRVRREGIDMEEQAQAQNIEMASDYFGGIGTER